MNKNSYSIIPIQKFWRRNFFSWLTRSIWFFYISRLTFNSLSNKKNRKFVASREGHFWPPGKSFREPCIYILVGTLFGLKTHFIRHIYVYSRIFLANDTYSSRLPLFSFSASILWDNESIVVERDRRATGDCRISARRPRYRTNVSFRYKQSSVIYRNANNWNIFLIIIKYQPNDALTLLWQLNQSRDFVTFQTKIESINFISSHLSSSYQPYQFRSVFKWS